MRVAALWVSERQPIYAGTQAKNANQTVGNNQRLKEKQKQIAFLNVCTAAQLHGQSWVWDLWVTMLTQERKVQWQEKRNNFPFVPEERAESM